MSDITILDGGMGKLLRRIGAPFRQPEWSALALMEAPEMVAQAHRHFVEAGAQVITTNNYAVVPYHHSDAFVAERLDELTALAGRIFRTVGRDLSLVAAWSRLVYTAFLGVAVIFFFQGLQLLDGTGLGAIPADERAAQALVAFETFNSTWLIGLLAFGLHLILTGAIILRSGIAPRGLAVVLVVAGLAYVIDTGAHTLLADYAEYADAFTAMVAVPAVLAEGWFGLWLLLRAGRGGGIATPTVGLGATDTGPAAQV